MPSVTTQNLSTAVAQVAQNTQVPAQQGRENVSALNQNQLAQISRVASDKQLSNPPKSDETRSPQRTKRAEANFAAQKEAPRKKGAASVDPESKPRVKDDGLMDVVA